MLYHGTSDQCVYDLWDYNKKIEDTHIDPHFFRRNGTCQNSVGHGQDTGPGHPDAAHGQDKPVFIGHHINGKKPNGTDGQGDGMCFVSAHLESNGCEEKGKDGGDPIVNPKDDTDPVTGILIGRTVAVVEVKPINMFCNGGDRKDPEPKQSEP